MPQIPKIFAKKNHKIKILQRVHIANLSFLKVSTDTRNCVRILYFLIETTLLELSKKSFV